MKYTLDVDVSAIVCVWAACFLKLKAHIIIIITIIIVIITEYLMEK